MRLLSLFTGIGAFEKAIKNIGIECETIGFSEIDKYAIKSYCAVHGESESKNLGDITKIGITSLFGMGKIDIITHGSPCQDFSVAGAGAGGDKGTETRSSLMWNTINIVSVIKPKYVVWENVKNLLSKAHRHNFDGYLEKMDSLGYNNYYQVLNAKDYGVPQNRERVYTISIRKDIDDMTFKFPEKKVLQLRLKDMLEKEVDEKYYLSDQQVDCILKSNFNTTKTRIQDKEYCDTLCARDFKDPKCVRVGGVFDDEKGKHQAGSVYDTDGLSPPLDTMQGGLRQPCIVKGAYLRDFGSRGKLQGEVCDTLVAAMGTGGGNVPIVEEEGIAKIITYNVPQQVSVRKHEVDTEKLVETLRKSKEDNSLTCEEISTKLNKPKTLVEHWFRKDNSFAIPDADIWFQLKELLKIETVEFDDSITIFEEREGVFEKANRVYDEIGIAPTLTQQEEKIIERIPLKFLGRNGKNIDGDYAYCVDTSNTGGVKECTENQIRIRKLTPRECWRLMGFTDADVDKCIAIGMSNSQLYKQAGNSIVVNVLEQIFKNLLI